MLRLFSLLAALTLLGCDASQTDPTYARIESVTVQNAPDETDGGPLRAELSTVGSDYILIAETEAGAGPFPLRLALSSALSVQTTDGPFDGQSLTLRLYQSCEETGCTGTSARGIIEVQPDGWPGTQRTVEVGGARVTLTYRRTTS